MTGSRQDRLYNLLPALYRQLDERQGQPLRALMAVLEGEFARLEEDLGAAYDDWFITTCDDWVVPYIADLLGVRDLQDVNHIPSQRRLVANTIAYRRRKGTPAVLEHVNGDATGWHARCVEFARQVIGTQHVAHTQPDSGRTVDVRPLQAAAQADGPLGTLARTVDVDNSEQGRYNLDRVGLFLYRLRSYPITRGFPRPLGRGRYTFDPLGRDIPLFNQPQPVTAITQRAQDVNLPLPLSRADLAADLKAYRAPAEVDRLRGPTGDVILKVKGDVTTPNVDEECQFDADLFDQYAQSNSAYYGPGRGLCVEGKGQPIPPSLVASADLSGWSDPAHLPDGAVVAVDVELGRFAFVDGKERDNLRVNYSYGFSSEVGGGPYGRPFWLEEPAPETHNIYVAKGNEVATFQAAFDEWELYCAQCARNDKKPIGRITILDNGLYGGLPLVIRLPRGAQLTIAAGDGVRPIIRPLAKLEIELPLPVKAVPEPALEEEIEPVIDRLLHLNGLVIDGGMQIGPRGKNFQGKLDVKIRHCTLMPDGLGVQFGAKDAAKLRVDIQHSIVGPLRLPAQVAACAVQDSIIDHSGGYAIAAPVVPDQPDLPPEQVPGPPVTLKRTTVFGKVSVQELPSASEVIFTAPVFVKDHEHGSISFSYLPAGSQTPPGEFCQPPDDASTSRVRPRFTSVRFGDPAYAQLSLDCPSELRRGGRDGAEMGVFCHLHQPQREISLGHVLDEYLPFGMSAAVFYET